MTTDPQPVQYDSEREAIGAAIALLDRMRATVAPQHPLANGVDIAVAEIRDHLARVRAAPAPAPSELERLCSSIAAKEARESVAPAPFPADGAVGLLQGLIDLEDIDRHCGDVGETAEITAQRRGKIMDRARAFLAARTEGGK